jgi:hypothetical protein
VIGAAVTVLGVMVRKQASNAPAAIKHSAMSPVSIVCKRIAFQWRISKSQHFILQPTVSVEILSHNELAFFLRETDYRRTR